MESLKTIRDSFHTQFLNIRNCEYLIQSDDFEIAYQAASPEERRQIKNCIERYDRVKIKEFIDEQIAKLTPFEKLGVRRLRQIGQHLKISNYSYMTKFELVGEIKNVVSRLKTNGERVFIQSEQPKCCAENSFGCG